MEKVEMIWLFIACALPNIFRAFQDRKGQTKQRKLLHNVWVYCSFLLAVGIVSAIQHDVSLIYEAVISLLVWRVCLFDYAVHAFLKKFSESHKKINILTYTGKSTYWHDQLVSHIPPAIRFGFRVLLFAGALVFFFRSLSASFVF